MKKNTDVPEVNSAIKFIERQIETIRHHSFTVPFETEPDDFLKFLSGWQSKKEQSRDNDD